MNWETLKKEMEKAPTPKFPYLTQPDSSKREDCHECFQPYSGFKHKGKLEPPTYPLKTDAVLGTR